MMRLAIIFAVVVGCAAAGLAQTTKPASSWKLVWADEFDRDGLPDPAKWGYEEGFVRNHELQYYTRARQENARVEKGMLIIEGRKETLVGRDGKKIAYTSASLITRKKESWTYGRIEVRAKVPAGKGMWPAIWTLGENESKVGWPACGEIDIMEFLGRQADAVHGTIHFRKDGKPASNGKELTQQDPSADFHVYATEWTPEEIRLYYDDKLYHTFAVKDADDAGGNPFRRPQYLILNLALGGDWGGTMDDSALPAQFLIDYVRVYRQVPATQPSH